METERKLVAMLAQLDQMAKDADQRGDEDEFELVHDLAVRVEWVVGVLTLDHYRQGEAVA